MQLKRDTEYAVRILYSLCQNRDNEKLTETKGETLIEISTQTGIPKTVAGRVCDNLVVKGIICRSDDPYETNKVYYSSKELSGYSLLDVIEAVEGTGKLFEVFDKRSEVYKNCEEQFLEIQKKTELLLTKATLYNLFNTHDSI